MRIYCHAHAFKHGRQQRPRPELRRVLHPAPRAEQGQAGVRWSPRENRKHRGGMRPAGDIPELDRGKQLAEKHRATPEGSINRAPERRRPRAHDEAHVRIDGGDLLQHRDDVRLVVLDRQVPESSEAKGIELIIARASGGCERAATHAHKRTNSQRRVPRRNQNATADTA